jgi:hypothetical protein
VTVPAPEPPLHSNCDRFVIIFCSGIGSQRVQEWNVSRKELQELVHAGVLTQAEVEEVISIEFNPVSALPTLIALHNFMWGL